ncbi:MAG: MCE family protein [Bacteroidia bacterium]|nr:MCE family protein [Bacteroidia bacterium]
MKLSKEVKVGILVTGALAGLFWGMNYLKGIDLFSNDNTYYAVYQNVDGLVPSSDVILNGVKIGQVTHITFLNDKTGRILATFLVSGKVFIGKDSEARIVSSDLLGGRKVDIQLDANSQPAVDGDTLVASVQTTLSDQVKPIKDKAESLIQTLDSLASSMNQVFNAQTKQNLNASFDNLNKSLKSIESASNSIDFMISNENGKLRKMIDNLESITTNVKNNNQNLSNVMKNFSQISDSLVKANLASTIQNADRVLNETASIMAKINKGEGTMGMLINDDSLYVSLERTASDLDKLLIDMKQNPKRYVHFSIFGGKGKPAKTEQ